MKITVNYSESDVVSLKVLSAKYVSDYIINVAFSNGSEKQVNFKLFLENAMNPSAKKYLNKKKFMKFDIIDGNINWNDYDMIFPVWDLYIGKIAG
jgi:hypothetical protein